MGKFVTQRLIRRGVRNQIVDIPGNTIVEFSDQEAKPLLDCGAIVAVAEEAPKKESGDEGGDKK